MIWRRAARAPVGPPTSGLSCRMICVPDEVSGRFPRSLSVTTVVVTSPDFDCCGLREPVPAGGRGIEPTRVTVVPGPVESLIAGSTRRSESLVHQGAGLGQVGHRVISPPQSRLRPETGQGQQAKEPS